MFLEYQGKCNCKNNLWDRLQRRIWSQQAKFGEIGEIYIWVIELHEYVSEVERKMQRKFNGPNTTHLCILLWSNFNGILFDYSWKLQKVGHDWSDWNELNWKLQAHTHKTLDLEATLGTFLPSYLISALGENEESVSSQASHSNSSRTKN